MRTTELSSRSRAEPHGRMRGNCCALPYPRIRDGRLNALRIRMHLCICHPAARSILCSLQAPRMRKSFGPAESTESNPRCRARPLQRPALPPAACSSIFRNAATVLAHTRMSTRARRCGHRPQQPRTQRGRRHVTRSITAAPPCPALPRPAPPRPARLLPTPLPSTSTCRSHLQSARSRVSVTSKSFALCARTPQRSASVPEETMDSIGKPILSEIFELKFLFTHYHPS